MAVVPGSKLCLRQ